MCAEWCALKHWCLPQHCTRSSECSLSCFTEWASPQPPCPLMQCGSPIFDKFHILRDVCSQALGYNNVPFIKVTYVSGLPLFSACIITRMILHSSHLCSAYILFLPRHVPTMPPGSIQSLGGSGHNVLANKCSSLQMCNLCHKCCHCFLMLNILKLKFLINYF